MVAGRRGESLNAVGIIQARMGSTRLRGKILAPLIDQQPLLAVLVKRLLSAPIDWWLATTHLPEDDLTEAWGDDFGIRTHRGDVVDVLSRFVSVVRATEPDWVVRITADDPFTDGDIVMRMLGKARRAKGEIALITETPESRRLPLGYTPQVIRGDALLHIADAIPEDRPYHRTHVTSYVSAQHRLEYAAESTMPPRPAWRWTVDTADDLAMARAAFSVFGADWSDIGYGAMVRLLDARPEVIGLNAHVDQKIIQDG